MRQAIPGTWRRRRARRRAVRATIMVLSILALQTLGWGNLLDAAEAITSSPEHQPYVADPTAGTQTLVVQDANLTAGSPTQAGAPNIVPAASGPVVAPLERAVWRGTARQEGHIRSGPARAAERIGELREGETVLVARWVRGDEVEKQNPTWAELTRGGFVYSSLLVSAPAAAPSAALENAPAAGRWVDVNLTLQTATAYEDARPVKSVLVSTGRPGWERPAAPSRSSAA